jgi:hypothetical protein
MTHSKFSLPRYDHFTAKRPSPAQCAVFPLFPFSPVP